MNVLATWSEIQPWITGALVPVLLTICGLLIHAQRQRGIVLLATEKRLMALETQMTPFWAAFQKEVADSLHHPHPESKAMDLLLEKLEALTLTEDETSELKRLLRVKADDPNEEAIERKRAEFLLFAMPRVVREREKSESAAGAALEKLSAIK